MKGIRYIIDAKGRYQAVIIDLNVHGALWEDFRDLLVSQERSKEPCKSLKKVEAKPRRSGKIEQWLGVSLVAAACQSSHRKVQ